MNGWRYVEQGIDTFHVGGVSIFWLVEGWVELDRDYFMWVVEVYLNQVVIGGHICGWAVVMEVDGGLLWVYKGGQLETCY